MEVLLISLPSRKEKEYKSNVAYPLGLGYLYTYLESRGVAVGILDLQTEAFSITDVSRLVAKEKPVLVGISFLTHNRFNAFQLAQKIKLVTPEVHIVFGGCHATNAPIDTIANTAADSIVCGEGEVTLYELYTELAEGTGNLRRVQGIVYRDGKDIIINPERPLIKNLDSLGFPHRKSFRMEAYSLKMPEAILKRQRYKSDNCAYIITSRGCPFKCSFCSTSLIWKNKVRFHSAKHIVDEIEILLKMGYNGIFIYDDFFTFDRRHVLSFCNEMKLRGLKIPLFCWGRVDSVTYDTFEKLKEVGLVGISIGIESGSQKILDYFQKNQTPEIVLKAVKVLKDLDIVGKGSFIGGSPPETLLDTYRTIRIIERIYKIQPEFIAGSGYTIGLQIHPGTKICDELFKSNYFPKDFSWTKKYKEVYERLGVPVYSSPSTKIIKFTYKIMRIVIEIRNGIRKKGFLGFFENSINRILKQPKEYYAKRFKKSR